MLFEGCQVESTQKPEIAFQRQVFVKNPSDQVAFSFQRFRIIRDYISFKEVTGSFMPIDKPKIVNRI
jgi:hypothetical protein